MVKSEPDLMDHDLIDVPGPVPTTKKVMELVAFLKAQLEPFSGLTGEDYEEFARAFVSAVNRHPTGVPRDQVGYLLPIFLRGNALVKYNQLALEDQLDYSKAIRKLGLYFLKPLDPMTSWVELKAVCQWADEPVVEYYDRFLKKARAACLKEDPDENPMVLAIFKAGLVESLKERLLYEKNPPTSLVATLKEALRLESLSRSLKATAASTEMTLQLNAITARLDSLALAGGQRYQDRGPRPFRGRGRGRGRGGRFGNGGGRRDLQDRNGNSDRREHREDANANRGRQGAPGNRMLNALAQTLGFVAMLAMIFGIVPMAEAYQICGLQKQGDWFEVPKLEACQVAEEEPVWEGKAEIFKEVLMPQVIKAHRCQIVNATMSVPSIFSFLRLLSEEPYDVLAVHGYVTTVEDCQTMVRELKLRDTPLVKVAPGYFRSELKTVEYLGSKRNKIAQSVVFGETEIAVTPQGHLLSPAGRLDGCRMDTGSCQAENATFIWTMTEQEVMRCPYQSVGTFSTSLTRNKILIKEQNLAAGAFREKELRDMWKAQLRSLPEGPEKDKAWSEAQLPTHRFDTILEQEFGAAQILRDLDEILKRREIERIDSITDRMVPRRPNLVTRVPRQSYQEALEKAHKKSDAAVAAGEVLTEYYEHLNGHSERQREADRQRDYHGKIQYAYESHALQSKKEFKRVFEELCNLYNNQLATQLSLLKTDTTTGARLLLKRNDIAAYMAGDALLITQCQQVNETLVFWNHTVEGRCFSNLPVRVGERMYFALPGSQDLVTTSPEVPCHLLPTMVYKSSGKYMANGQEITVRYIEREQVRGSEFADLTFGAPSVFLDEIDGNLPISYVNAVLNKMAIVADRQKMLNGALVERGVINLPDITLPSLNVSGVPNAVSGTVSGIFGGVREKAAEALNELKNGILKSILYVVLPVLGLFLLLVLIFFGFKCYLSRKVAVVGATTLLDLARKGTPRMRQAVLRLARGSQGALNVLEMEEGLMEDAPPRRARRPSLLSMPELNHLICMSVDSAQLPYAAVNVNNKKVFSLVDTGANLSFISRQTCDALKVRIEKGPVMWAKAANGTLCRFQDKANLILTLAGQSISKKIWITDQENPPAPMLLGTDTLKKFGVISFDFNRNTLAINGKSVPLIKRNQMREYEVAVTEKVEIPAGGVVQMLCDTTASDVDYGSEVYIEGIHSHGGTGKDDEAYRLYLIAQAVDTIGNNGKVWTRIWNCGRGAITFHSNQRIATAKNYNDIVCHMSGFVEGEPESPELLEGAYTDLGELPSNENWFEELNLEKSNLSAQGQSRLKEIILKHEAAFVTDGRIGHFTGKTRHRIELEPDYKMPTARPYPTNPMMKREIEKQLETMEKNGVIEPSTSPFSSPVLLVPKTGDYSKLAESLTSMTKMVASLKGVQNDKKKLALVYQEHGKREIEWNESSLEAFDKLKKAMTEEPVLMSPDFSKPFRLESDASIKGLSAILMQADDEKRWHPISYWSRPTKGQEPKFPPIELEALALLGGLRKHHQYIVGAKVECVTDHSPLVSLLTRKDVTGRLAKYQAQLGAYDLTIVYRKGCHNHVADALSRSPVDLEVNAVNVATESVIARNLGKVRKEQFADAKLRQIIDDIKNGIDNDANEKYLVIQNLLYYVPIGPNDSPRLVIPEKSELRWAIVKQVHNAMDEAAHLGIKKTKDRIAECAIWNHMEQDITSFVNGCLPCQRRKDPRHYSIRLPLGQYDPPRNVGDRLHLDVLGPLPMTARKHKYAVVAVDAFSKYVFTKAVERQTAEEMVVFLSESVLAFIGCPTTIVTDQGANFVGETFRSCLLTYGIEHLITSPYHHQANGQVERTNRTLETAMTPYLKDRDWDNVLPLVTTAINRCVHEVTGVSPARVLFGFNPTSPFEAKLGRPRKTFASPSEYLEKLEGYVYELRAKVADKLEAGHERQKDYFDQKWNVKMNVYDVGDKVLLRRETATKLEYQFSRPMIVIDILGNNLVLEDPVSKKRTITHANRVRRYNEGPAGRGLPIGGGPPHPLDANLEEEDEEADDDDDDPYLAASLDISTRRVRFADGR
ncbi:unnamed protein product, partial [Mesorhabditis spiculigera]